MKIRKACQSSRKCILQNIHSGRVIEADSIANFCREARLYKNARYHITPILDGKRPSYKGWFRPETLNESVKLKDIYNNVYRETSFKELVKRKILTSGAVNSLISGNKKVVNRLALASTNFNTECSPRSWKIVHVEFEKNGQKFSGITPAEAAMKMGYPNAANFYPLVYGWKDSVGGVRLTNLKVEDKQILDKISIV